MSHVPSIGDEHERGLGIKALRSAKPRLASEISHPYAYLYAPTVTIAVVVILLFI